MPHMFGVEVAREVRALGLPIYIVGCTGNALREDQDEYLAAGADDVIPKPVHEAAIREQLARAKTIAKRVSVRVPS
jgi:CheY-like chemotaxis protein